MPSGRWSFDIRLATAADAPQLLELSREAIRRSAADHYSRPQLEAWASRRSLEQHRRLIAETATFVAVEGAGVAGFVSVALEATDELVPGEVDQLFVHPDYGGRGIARALLQAAESAVGEAAISELTTHASWRAVPVFERLGYAQTTVEKVQLGDQALTRANMRKRLTDPPA